MKHHLIKTTSSPSFTLRDTFNLTSAWTWLTRHYVILHIQSKSQLLFYLLTISYITRPYTWPYIVFRFSSRNVPHIVHVLRHYPLHHLILYYDLQFVISSDVFCTLFLTSFVSFFTFFTLNTPQFSLHHNKCQVPHLHSTVHHNVKHRTSLASTSLAGPTLPRYLTWP